MKKIIDEIIALEWAFFDKVNNEGGRAPCQDDFRTFQIMRGSQYEAWDDATLESWRDDLNAAKAEGRNPLEEKYARMMCIDAPDENRALASQLPPISEEKKNLALAITRRLAPQNEAFAARFPLLAAHARPIHRTDGEEGETSVETYQLGELLTYSEKTLRLLASRIDGLAADGESYAEIIIENGLKRRGFAGLDQAENFLKNRFRKNDGELSRP